MSVVAAQVNGFSALLKHWRSFRRLSQLDLSMQAEVSQRHVSFLESGRAKPSRDMVVQLAESLELPLRERNRLLSAAGFAPLYSAHALDAADMTPVNKALSLILQHHEPYPAVVVDAQWNLVSANQALLRLFALLGDVTTLWQTTCPGGPANLLKLTFHPQGLRPHILNFEEIAPLMINRTFREAHDHPDLYGLLDEILNYPGMPSRWKTPDLSQNLPPLMSLNLAAGAHRIGLFSTITTFGTPQDVTADELRVESFFPIDDASEILLKALAA